MTAMSTAPACANDFIKEFRFHDFEVSWAGAGATPGVFAFGSEDGRLLTTDVDGVVLTNSSFFHRPGEAINGAAFLGSGGWLCVTTRTEIVLWQFRPDNGLSPIIAPIEYGAHGVVASNRGRFHLPLGPFGFMSIQPDETPGRFAINLAKSLEPVYFYRVTTLPVAPDREIIVSASRKHGITTMDLSDQVAASSLISGTFDGFDVIDVCALDPQNPRSTAVAALGIDGTISLVRDPRICKDSVTIKYDIISGTAYRVVANRRCLFVLTSTGLFIIPDLVAQFRRGEAIDLTRLGYDLPMEAIDLNLVDGRWLLIVLADSRVLRLDTERLDVGAAGQRVPTLVSTDWQLKSKAMNVVPIASAV